MTKTNETLTAAADRGVSAPAGEAAVLAVLDSIGAASVSRRITPAERDALYQARVAVAEVYAQRDALIEALSDEDIGEILAALQKAHGVCTGVVKLSRSIGPMYSHANTAAWGLSGAINRVERLRDALARCGGAK